MANPTMVQSSGGSVTNAQTWAVAFNSNNTQGDALVACGLVEAPCSPSVSDTQNNSWTVLTQTFDFGGSTMTLILGYVLNAKSGANTITLASNYGSNQFGYLFSIGEISGVTGVDVSASAYNNATTSPWTGASITTNYATEMLISIFGTPNSSFSNPISIGSPFTAFGTGDIGASAAASAYDVVTSVGSYSSTVTQSGSTIFGNIILGFYQTSGGGDDWYSPSIVATLHGMRG